MMASVILSGEAIHCFLWCREGNWNADVRAGSGCWLPGCLAEPEHIPSPPLSCGDVSPSAGNLNLTRENANNRGRTFRFMGTQIKARSKESLLITSHHFDEIPSRHDFQYERFLWAQAWVDGLHHGREGLAVGLAHKCRIKSLLRSRQARKPKRQDATRITSLEAHPCDYLFQEGPTS